MHVDRQSIENEELEYEYLRSLCDLAMAYRRLVRTYGGSTDAVSRTITCMERELNRISDGFGGLRTAL